TETSPVLSLNTPFYFKSGTMGQFVPGLDYQIKQVRHIKEGGELWVKGPNIMQGYVKEDKPGVIQSLKGGWYNTGDIVQQDADGYITMGGRMKRFAKIGG